MGEHRLLDHVRSEGAGREWGVLSFAHELPRPKMWGRADSIGGGVCRRSDGGRTWRVSNEAMPEMAAADILPDPNSPVEARVLYVAGLGRGVYKSIDGIIR